MKRALTSAAFAHWCFLNVWTEFANGRDGYLLDKEPWRWIVAPTLIYEAALAACVYALWRAAGLGRVMAAVAVIPVGLAGTAMLRFLPGQVLAWLVSPAALAVSAMVAAVFCGWLLARPRAAAAALYGTMLWSWPVLLLITAQALRSGAMTKPPGAYEDGPRAPMLAASGNGPRLVWVIFDALSEEIAFQHRPAGMQLPQLDRLRQQSFFSTSATSPADNTMASIPALLTGAMQPARDWWRAENVFDDARQRGLHSGAAGWYHPYGRVLAGRVSAVGWESECGGFDPVAQLTLLPFVRWIPWVDKTGWCREEMRGKMERLMRLSTAQVADARLSLVFLHLPVPHAPALRRPVGMSHYAANLPHVDEALGALRAAVDHAGLADRTAWMVSADHGWRPHVWRGTANWSAEDEQLARFNTPYVPFLVRLPKDRAAMSATTPFRTILSRRLADAILAGTIQTHSQVDSFIRYNSVSE